MTQKTSMKENNLLFPYLRCTMASNNVNDGFFNYNALVVSHSK